MQKIGLKIGGYITLTALGTQKTLILQGYLHGRKLYVGKYPKISEKNNTAFCFPTGSVVSNYRNYKKNQQVEVEISTGETVRWYRVSFCEELAILSENGCTSMMEMIGKDEERSCNGEKEAEPTSGTSPSENGTHS